jgi:hypothetical protein
MLRIGSYAIVANGRVPTRIYFGFDKPLMNDNNFLVSASLSCHQSVDQTR